MKTKDFLEFGPFRAVIGRRMLLRDNQLVPLPGKAFEVLQVLLQRPGETVSKDELMKAVWPDTFVEEGNLTQTVFVLRKALGDADGQSFIITIPRQGYRFAGEVRGVEEPEPIPGATVPEQTALPKSKPRSIPRSWLVAGILAGVLTVVALGAWWYAGRATKPALAPLMSLNVDLGPEAVANGETSVAISPDGTRIVFRIRTVGGRAMLAVRSLDLPQNRPVITPLHGTEGAGHPFFSADGQWVAYTADGKLKKTPIQGGAPVTICDAPNFSGGSWGEDNQIIATLGSPPSIFRIPAGGGPPQLLAKPPDRKEVQFRWPALLPGGNEILFTARAEYTSFENASIEVMSRKTGHWKTLHRGGYFGRYLPSGHLVWVQNRTLFGARFDPRSLEMKSAPVPLVEEDLHGDPEAGDGRFDFSRNGTLVYLPGNSERSVVWMDPEGRTEALVSNPAHYRDPTLSPDGKFLAMTIGLGRRELYIFDLQRQTSSRRTFSGACRYPAWTMDGKYIAMSCAGPHEATIMWMRADGSGEPQLIYKMPGAPGRFALSPDGRTLVVSPLGPVIWTVPLDVTDPDHPIAGKPELFQHRTKAGFTAAFSPDGRWIAYSSYEPGETGIYVLPVGAGRSGKWQISYGEGRHPTWSRSGHQLIYQDNDGHIQVVDYVLNGDSFSIGKPRRWVDKQFDLGISATPGRNFDLAPDGKRIVAFELKANLHATFLVNFFDELRRRIPDGTP